jgi:D-alanine transaminase
VSRVAYVNGRYVPHNAASVHVEDRGFQFADGVYEVIAVKSGTLIDEELHLVRLARSLSELRIARPLSDKVLRHLFREVLRRNGVKDGILYLQITRGAAPRDHAFPKAARPSVVITARHARLADPAVAEHGVEVVTVPDIRWRRNDIKSVSLLPNVLGKQRAREAGAYEAWMVSDAGEVTEGTSTNAWIVTRDGTLVTRPADAAILNGVTRVTILRLAREAGLSIEERSFSLDEAKHAAEAFLSSTTSYVMPVVRIDGVAVGDGSPGKFTKKLLDTYRGYIAA